MSAGALNITIEIGSKFELELTLKDDAGLPVDLTNHEFSGQIRKFVGDLTPVCSFTFTKLAQTGATLGKVRMTLTATQTRSIPIAIQKTAAKQIIEMAYDVESIPNGVADDTIRWIEGVAFISPEVTR